MKFNLTSVLIILFFFSQSCKEPYLPDNINASLESAQQNRSELIKVINHYAKDPKDSLKLKAAYFLIKNLNNRYFFDGKFLNNYLDYSKLVLRDLDHGEYILKSFNKVYGPFKQDSLVIHLDLQDVTSDQLISNIDEAFVVWRKQPWGKDYSFQQFCDYILPYRIWDEIPEYNRQAIYNRFKHLLNGTNKRKLDAVTACALINDDLIKEGWILSNRTDFLPHNPASKVVENRVGSCREMVDLGIYVMRAVGIPVTYDFLPQWPYRRQGHSWDVVFDKNGKAVPFLAAEDSPGTPHRPGTKRGKVYRHTFAINPLSLANTAPKNQAIPAFLNDPYIEDVTEEYAKTHSVHIETKVNNDPYVYLAVFNDVDWVPIAWTKNKTTSADFKKVEGGIVYLPTNFTNGGIKPIDQPFVLNEKGTLKFLYPDTVHKLSKMVCTMVYPTVAESYKTDMATGGIIQGANKKDFSDHINVFKFNVRSMPGWNNIIINSRKSFRYLRFIAANQKKCAISEFQAFMGGQKIPGKGIGGALFEGDIVKHITDGDTLTAYSSALNGAWVGVDLKQSVKVDKIKLMSEIDLPEKHFIIPGKTYTLKYWSSGRWVNAGSQIAKSKNVQFYNVPSNALYLLTSDSDIKDVRIFTYEHGQQKMY